MAERAVRLVEEPDRLRAALTPLRRRLLELLRVPTSATELAATLGLPRQKVNYHVRALEAAGLVRLVEERQRRGCCRPLPTRTWSTPG
jgi:DNA-binding transcriptional ArsR family regulator